MFPFEFFDAICNAFSRPSPLDCSEPPMRDEAPAPDTSWHESEWFREWLEFARRDYHGRP